MMTLVCRKFCRTTYILTAILPLKYTLFPDHHFPSFLQWISHIKSWNISVKKWIMRKSDFSCSPGILNSLASKKVKRFCSGVVIMSVRVDNKNLKPWVVIFFVYVSCLLGHSRSCFFPTTLVLVTLLLSF